MIRSALRLVLRGALAVAAGALLLSLSSPALSVRAQDDPTFYSEMTLVGPLTIYADANTSSAVKATLSTGSVVDVLTSGRVIGADGTVWARVRQPSGEDLGWAKMTELNVAAGNDPYYGVSAFGTPSYNPGTGSIYNPGTGTYTPISPYNPLTPYQP